MSGQFEIRKTPPGSLSDKPMQLLRSRGQMSDVWDLTVEEFYHLLETLDSARSCVVPVWEDER